MSLVLSTSWNAFRHHNGRSLVAEIKALGFKEIELSFNLTSSILKDIRSEFLKKQIKITSLHNFCPIPKGLPRKLALPDCYSMASPNQRQRQNALRYTKKTIDTASLINGSSVILHCGRVEIPDRTRKLINLYNKGRRHSKEFRELRKAYKKERDGLSKPFFENALRSLEELNRYAKKKNVLLGIETRAYYREIPNLEETGVILDKFKNSNLRYWHDTGHAQIMENLGFTRHREYLDLYAKDMLGIHLHGVVGCFDHQAPIESRFRFSWIKPYLKKTTLKVIEAHYPASASAVRESKEYLERLFSGKN